MNNYELQKLDGYILLLADRKPLTKQWQYLNRLPSARDVIPYQGLPGVLEFILQEHMPKPSFAVRARGDLEKCTLTLLSGEIPLPDSLDVGEVRATLSQARKHIR
jgi:hypothetical protein